MLIDSKMLLSCSVRAAVSKRGAHNVSEELSLNGLELRSSLLLHKKKKKVKKEGNPHFLLLVLRLQDAGCGGLRGAARVCRTGSSRRVHARHGDGV